MIARTFVVASIVSVLVLGVAAKASADPSLPIVPLPRNVQLLGGTYAVSPTIAVQANDDVGKPVADALSAYLRSIFPDSSPTGPSVISLNDAANDPQLGTEGYRLTIDDNGVAIAADAPAGLFYGVQSLEQLLPDSPQAQVTLPRAKIVDWPEYRWRGIHLDVSRHFFPVPVVEQYLDLAARYKLNVFHWHLSDDQGWRLQIKKYPLLTQIGGCRNGTQVGGEGTTAVDNQVYCGSYTQDEIRDVVSYAAARYVTVVPELDMPGHSDAAIASYPWLGCTPLPVHVRELWGESGHAICPTDRSFAFIDEVMGEVASLFPGPFIHIGGDEVLTDDWEASPFVASLMKHEHLKTYRDVQGYFTHREERIVAKYGKRVIGWDDIWPGGVAPSTAIVAWNSRRYATQAAQAGNDVVMNPDGPLYFDAAQGNKDLEPLSIGGLTTLEMVYDYDPSLPGLTPAQAAHVIGAQGDLWAEYIPTADHLFYMLLPRELALAELCWTPRSQMSWFDFIGRVGPQLSRLESEGYHYRIPLVTFEVMGQGFEFPEQQPTENDMNVVATVPTVGLSLSDIAPGAVVHYTEDGSTPTASSPAYVPPGAGMSYPSVSLTYASSVTITAIAILPDGRASAPAVLRLTTTYRPGRCCHTIGKPR